MSELHRAKLAFEQVAAVKELDNYKINIRKMPMMIQVNGLAQTVSFYRTKKEQHGVILKHLYDHLLQNELIEGNANQDLVETVISLNSENYRIVTSEVMSYLQWLKRFADGRDALDRK